MKRIIYGFVVIILLSFLFDACKKDNAVNPPARNNDTGYFPNGDGSAYTYSIEKTDSGGTQTTGTRSTDFEGTEVKNGINYQVQIDSFNLSGVSEISMSYFRKTYDTLYYFLDTTGLSTFIPDSLKDYVRISTEMKLLSFPVTENKSWSVFNLSISYFIFTIPIMTVNASYDGTESVTLHLLSGDTSVDAVKIRFRMDLTIPNTPESSYSTYAWLTEGIGIVKWQGNGVILNALTGGSVNLADTSSTITEDLISYDAKQ